MRRFLSALLALLLVLTTQEVAVARGAAAGELAVICGPGGLIAVTLDDQGQPRGAGHYCPDGLMALVSTAAVPVVSIPPQRLVAMVPPSAAALLLPPASAVLARARAPPLMA